jgi:hypothetical protein
MVIPQQTSLVIYTVSLIVTIREPSAPTITKPISTNPKGGMVDPEKKEGKHKHKHNTASRQF